MTVTILQGDCLEVMKTLPSASVDLILCDLPYGTTQNKWDSVVPFAPLWEQYKRLLKPARAIVLTAAQPFSSALVMSNPTWFRYDWSWRKSNATGHLNSKKMPMRQHEDILVFAESMPVYYPQMFEKEKPRAAQRSVKSKGSYGDAQEGVFRTAPIELGYPRSALDFSTAYHAREAGLHPTQKPVGLMEYLIRTYSNTGELILDNCAGSGTTGIAAARTGRHAVLIEREPKYVEIIKQRVDAELGVFA